jgi:hypothetical protein
MLTGTISSANLPAARAAVSWAAVVS